MEKSRRARSRSPVRKHLDERYRDEESTVKRGMRHSDHASSSSRHHHHERHKRHNPTVDKVTDVHSDCKEKSESKEGPFKTNPKDYTLTPEQRLEKALDARKASLYKADSAVKLASNQKRKLLWSKNKSGRSWNNWESASFQEDGQDDKFRRLMGIKSKASSSSDELKKKNDKMLQELEVQYETSRFMTHKARGAGFGYGSSTLTLERQVEQGTDELFPTK